MKARLLVSQDTLYLLLCTGQIDIISPFIAREFILRFDDPQHYYGPGAWDFENLTMESYQGHTIAFVDDEYILHVVDSEKFRDILTQKEPKLLTVPEYAALHGKKTAIIRRFCLDGRIRGAIQKGTRWLIPEDSPYPGFDSKLDNKNCDP